jgi:hypothetical protein
MKRVFTGLLLLAMFVAGTSCAATYGQSGPSAPTRAPMRSPRGPINVSYFYENLSPDGQWFPDPTYGWCWTPYDVSEDWRPYSEGHWEYSDYGWSWASDESFGWATYHYGRWFFDESYGWAWVPGTEWAPAWVAWRVGDDWMGWAPLPPTARWDANAGLSYREMDGMRSDDWCFVPRRNVFDLRLSVQLTSVARNVTLLERSRDATRFEVREGRPANVGFDVAQVELTMGRNVPRVRIADVDTPTRGRGQSAGNGVIGFFRPKVEAVPATQAPAPSMAGRKPVIGDADLQRLKDERGRKLEADLVAERGRLTRDHESELRGQAPGPAIDEIRKRHASEQAAFDAHAVQQRQVLAQRIQKQVVRPEIVKSPGKSDPQDKGNKDKAKGKGKDKGGQ